MAWDQSADVVVVGSGFAGLSAAIEAALAGCTVIIIEKRDFHGGNSWISGGVMAAVDVHQQAQQGIRDSTQTMYADLLRAGKSNNPELLKLLCQQAYSALQWLKLEMGVQFLPRLDQLGGHTVPRCHSVEDLQGRNIINRLLAYAAELPITIRLNTAMTQLYQTNTGCIEGVGCSGLTIQARKAVILASGGYSGESTEYQAATARTSLADSTGEVLTLAEQAGATLVDMEYLQMLPCASPDEAGRGVAPVFASYVIFPYGIMVDPDTGQRFVNEWTDRKTRSDAMLALARPAVGITDSQGLHQAGEMFREHMDEQVTRRFASLTELAAWQQIPKAALETTLQNYNKQVVRGQDTDYGKPIPAKARPMQAPYYAVRLQPKAHSTMGGIRINAQTAVLDQVGEPIPGLYAAGEVTCGIHGISRLACCAITECIVFGRIAGQQSAVEINK